MQSSETEVLIIGAGPVGLVMANELTRRNIACRIVDKTDAPTDKSKALIVHARTLDALDNMGLAAKFVDEGLRGRGISMWVDGKSAAHIAFEKIDSTYPFPLFIEQSKTESLLIDHLATQGKQVERGVELTDFTQDDEGVTAFLTHKDGSIEQVRCTYLVGCDGSHSTVRHKLNIPFEGQAYQQLHWLADVSIEWDLEPDYIHNFISKGDVMVAVPMVGNRYRLIIVIRDSTNLENVEPTLEQVQQRVNMLTPKPAKLSDPRWLAPFHSHHRKVERFSEGRVFLAGDDAHIHSPAGGQGMNTGMQDAHNLAWKLAQVLREQANPLILDSYHAERNPIAEKVLRQTDLMFRTAQSNSPVFSEVRNHVLPIVTSFGLVQEKMQNMMLQLDINYRHSSLVSHVEHSPTNLRSGDHAPNAPLTVAGQPQIQNLYDVFRQGQYTLLMLSGAHPTAQTYQQLHEIAKTISEKYNQSVQICLVVAGGNPTQVAAPCLLGLDESLETHQKYEAKSPMLCLVRPDGYIAFFGQGYESAKLEVYMSQVLMSAEQAKIAV